MSQAPLVASASSDEMVRRARGLVDRLRSLTGEAERLRRLPEESFQLVRANQLIRMLQGPAMGGHALSLRTHLDVVSTLAEGCSATAWVVGVGHAHSWMINHMSEQAQLDAYGDDPDALIAGVIGPRGRAVEQPDGSYVLDGTWPFGSGCEHASWLLLGAQLFNVDGEPDGDADLLVPVSAVEFKDDWFVAGLQGTGSCSIVAKGVVVPPHRKLPLIPLLERQLPTYEEGDAPAVVKAQALPVLALCISSAALGTARVALSEYRRMVPGKKVMYTSHISHEWIPNQVVLGRAASTIHAAELILYRVADDIDDYAARDAEMPKETRARIRMDCSLAVRFCLEATEQLYMNGGASGLSLSSPLQRAARDLRAMNMHGLLLLETSAEIYGRVLLGLDSNSPIY